MNLWSNVNILPSKAYFAFISQSAVNGSNTKNIFNFQNLAEEIALYVSDETIPARPMKINVGADKNHVTPFVNLFEVSEKWNKDSGLSITRSMFSEGYTVYAFSLVPSYLGEEYINLVRQGSVRLDVKFATNTTETLTCLAYAEFPALIEIDQSTLTHVLEFTYLRSGSTLCVIIIVFSLVLNKLHYTYFTMR